MMEKMETQEEKYNIASSCRTMLIHSYSSTREFLDHQGLRGQLEYLDHLLYANLFCSLSLCFLAS